MIELARIRRDGGTQSRAAINPDTVAEYADAMADPNTVFPPIIVYFDGRDYWLADGFHRVAAWERLGWVEVPAEVRQGDRRRAILHSVAANSAHGLRRTNEDKRRAVLTLLEDTEWSAWSDREIAKRCAVSHDFVSRIRRSLSSDDSENPQEARTYFTRHGTEAVMNTARIGVASNQDQIEAPGQRTENAGETVQFASSGHRREEVDQKVCVPADDLEAKARRELARLTPEALIDEVLGLRMQLAGLRIKRQGDKERMAELEATVAALEAQGDMGAKLSRALGEVRKVNARLKETQAQLARETRRANAMEKDRDALRKRLEGQIIDMGAA